MTRRFASVTAAAVPGALLTTALVSGALGQDFVLATDPTGDKIVRYDADTGAPIDHFVGDGISPLSNPIFLKVTPDGDIAAASRGTDSIELYDGQTGAWIRTLIAPRAGSLRGPKDMAFDADGNIYVSSSENDRVLKYAPDGTFTRNLINAGLREPSGVAVGPDGLLYVASRDNDLVRSYDTETGQRIERLELEGTGIDGPNGVAFGPDGALYIGGRFSDSIVRVPAFGAPAVLVQASPLLDGPGQLSFDAEGDLIVVSQDTDVIARFDASTGAPLGTIVTPAFAGGLTNAVGAVFVAAPVADTPGCSPADVDQDDDVDIDDLNAFVDLFIEGCL